MPNDENNFSRHLDHGRYGDQQLNPDEQNMYLGTFKERVYYIMTVAQLEQTPLLTEWEQALQKFPDAQLILNGNLPINVLTPYLQLARKYHFAVQLKNDNRYQTTPTSNAVILINDAVVDNPAQNIISLKQASSTHVIEKAKESWWQKLFKGKG